MLQDRQRGFTLIELIVVIVILGILAATALPKFQDLSGDAGTAAAQGVAGAISSGTSLNFARYTANSANGARLSSSTVICSNTTLQSFVSGVTLVGTTPTDNNSFLIGGSGTCGAAGSTVNCTVTPKAANATAATATVTCTG